MGRALRASRGARAPRAAIAVLVSAALLAGCDSAQAPSEDPIPEPADAIVADRVFINGKVLTVNAEFDIADALALDEDRLLAVGSNEEVLALADDATETIDLEGRTVVPGLIDNHMHFVRAARDWYRHVRWDDATSREEALARIRERASSLPPDEWIVVIGGWTFNQFEDDSSVFTLAELDALAPERPLYIQEGYRRAFANTAALEAAGIAADASLAAGAGAGTAVTDDEGNLTGELRGAAMQRVSAAMPDVPPDVWDGSLRQTMRDMNAMGLTAVYDVGGFGVVPAYYDAVERAAADDELTMRIFCSLHPGHGIGTSAEEIIAALETIEPDFAGLVFAQFGWGETTYPPMRGPLPLSAEVLENYEAIALAAAEHGWQLHEHSMRDEKIRAMIDVFRRVDAQDPIDGLRWTIAHTNNISPESVQLAADLGLVFAVHSSARLTDPGSGSGDTPPPIRTIHESSARWGLGSDATTVASPNPFHNLEWAVTGLSAGGAPSLEETVPREIALTAHTLGNAYLLFRDEFLGSLEPDKVADFVVLDRDYMTVPAEEIGELRPVMTVVGGEIVYSSIE